MNILLLSKDEFLIDFLKSKYESLEVKNSKFLNLKDDEKDYDVVIFDNFKTSLILNYIGGMNLDNKLVINISNEKIDGAVNISLPFKINNLTEIINNFIKYFENNIIKILCGTLNANKKHFTDKTNKSISLTDKEIEVLQFLIKNNDITKEDLFVNLWNTKVQNIKLVETIIYNIKQKFSSIGIDDFIFIKYGVCEIKK